MGKQKIHPETIQIQLICHVYSPELLKDRKFDRPRIQEEEEEDDLVEPFLNAEKLVKLIEQLDLFSTVKEEQNENENNETYLSEKKDQNPLDLDAKKIFEIFDKI